MTNWNEYRVLGELHCKEERLAKMERVICEAHRHLKDGNPVAAVNELRKSGALP